MYVHPDELARLFGSLPKVGDVIEYPFRSGHAYEITGEGELKYVHTRRLA